MSEPIPAEVFEAAYGIYLDMDGARGMQASVAAAVAYAYRAGRGSLPHVPNDIEATGGCCCNGCIGEGPCDLEVPERRNDWEVA